MPRNPHYKRIELYLTESQYAALQQEVALFGLSVQDILRASLAARIEGFKVDDMPRRGTYARRPRTEKRPKQ